MDGDLRITEFANVMQSTNEKDRKFYMKDRYASSFLFVYAGQLRFITDDREYICDRTHPLYIPKGASYLNCCTDTASSYMFTFYDNGVQNEIENLREVDIDQVKTVFDRIERLSYVKDRNQFKILSLLYSLMALINEQSDLPLPTVISSAMRMMTGRISDPSLQVSEIAKELSVSEIYLRQLFTKHLGLSPRNYLVKIRMEKARSHLLENQNVTETAYLCGYTNIYGFSRAYKRYHGKNPSDEHIKAAFY